MKAKKKKRLGFLDFFGVDHHDRIIWILLVTFVWYVVLFSTLEGFLFDGNWVNVLVEKIGYEVDAMKFSVMYLSTITPFVGFIVYTAVTKRNRFVLRDILPGHKNNKIGWLFWGLAVGFIMNFGCILCALINGDIKLFLNFTMSQLPFYLITLVFVFIQSSSEEMWCRAFVYERVNVHYPLWVAILVNGIFFGALHLFNPGVTALPIIDIMICGVSFSLAKWYSGSIWFPMGIHTMWNFTQNLIFGLPNSGIVSEASIFGLDAASAHDSIVYNVAFGVEGAWPAVAADAVLGLICLILAARKGRLGELTQRLGTEAYEKDMPQTEDGVYVYADAADASTVDVDETRD